MPCPLSISHISYTIFQLQWSFLASSTSSVLCFWRPGFDCLVMEGIQESLSIGSSSSSSWLKSPSYRSWYFKFKNPSFSTTLSWQLLMHRLVATPPQFQDSDKHFLIWFDLLDIYFMLVLKISINTWQYNVYKESKQYTHLQYHYIIRINTWQYNVYKESIQYTHLQYHYIIRINTWQYNVYKESIQCTHLQYHYIIRILPTCILCLSLWQTKTWTRQWH